MVEVGQLDGVVYRFHRFRVKGSLGGRLVGAVEHREVGLSGCDISVH